MKRYKVYFDYEMDDAVEVEAETEKDARWQVADMLRQETCDYDDWTWEDLMFGLNAELA